MEIELRNIEESDLTSVVDLLKEFAAYEELSEYCEITVEKLRLAMFSADSNVEGLIAVDGDTPVAYALYFPSFASFRGQRGFYLEDIYIKPEYRRADLGERMIRTIASTAASRGFERIDFNVLLWNTPAVNFYDKFGAVRNDDERHFKFDDEAFKRLAAA